MMQSQGSIRRFVNRMNRSSIPREKWNDISRESSRLKIFSNRTGFALALYLAVQAATIPALLAFSFYVTWVLRDSSLLLAMQNQNSLPSLLTQTAIYVVSMSLCFLMLGLFLREKPFASVQAGPVREPWLLLPAAGITLAFVFLGNFASELIAGIMRTVGYEPYMPGGENVPRQISALAVYVLMVCVLAPICEELVFRGFLLRHLRRYGNVFAIVVSSLLFAMLHGNLLQAPFAFVVGLALGYFAIRLGSVRATMVLHALVNGFAVVTGVLQNLYGSARAGIISDLAFAVILLLAIAALAFLYRSESLTLPEPEERAAVLPESVRSRSFFVTPGFLAFAGVTLCMLLFFIRHV